MPWKLILSQDEQALLLRCDNNPPRRFVAKPAAFGIAYDCAHCALDAIDRDVPCGGTCYNPFRADSTNVVWEEAPSCHGN